MKLSLKRSCCLGLLLAWVFWIRDIGPGDRDVYVLQSAFDTRDQCIGVLIDYFDKMRKDGPRTGLTSPLKEEEIQREKSTAKQEGRAQLYYGEGTKRMSLEYICLPDSVDPSRRRRPAT